MKKELRYIRYRICRNIYYADQCPMENRKNYNNIGKNILCACGLGVGVLGFMVLAVVLAYTTIRFEGTEAQWDEISKGVGWNFNTGNYTVIFN